MRLRGLVQFIRSLTLVRPPPAVGRAPALERLEERRLLSGRGLAGYYFAGTDFTDVKLQREDPQLNFTWNGTPDASIPAGGFGVRWSGRAVPKFSELYHFYTRTTGGVRLWVDNTLLIDDWTVHPLKDNKGSISLRAGVRYDVRVEYFDTSALARAELHWMSKRQAREAVPQNRLFASEPDIKPPTAPSRLKATYVTDTAFKWVWNPSADDSETIVYETYIGRTRLGSTTETYYTRGGRVPQTTYNVTVRAIDFAGNVSISEFLPITTAAPVPDGSGIGLAAMYFAALDLTQFRLTRTDPQILFSTSNFPFESSSNEPLSACWTGNLLAKYTELHTFTIASDGGVRLWVGGQLIIDKWNQSTQAEHLGSIKLRAGQSYSIVLEYRHFSGDASLSAVWSSLSMKPATIPASQLFPAFVDESAPSAPANLRIDTVGQISASFSWDAASDDVGIARYDVYRDGNLIGSTATTSYYASGLQPDADYSFTVMAVDGAARVSPVSSALAVTTQDPAPRNAQSVLPAVDFNRTSGVSRNGSVITSLDDGDWVKFTNLSFGSGIRSFRVKLGVPVNSAGGRIELRLESPDGPLIGTHTIQPTGAYSTHYWQRVAVSNVSANHDLYLVFKGGNGVAEIESFQFSTQRLTRVMALGDSITASNPGLNSYRYYLWQRLLGGGYGADFVGSLIRNDVGPPANLDFDQNHEGHPGWRADEILGSVSGWIASALPEVVLLHVGTNDLWDGQSVSSTVAEVGQIIDAIRAVNPSIKILLAQIVPLSGFETEVVQFNSALVDLVADKTIPGSPLVLVDMHSGFNPSIHQYDGVHLSAQGESLMADRWYDALTPYLS